MGIFEEEEEQTKKEFELDFTFNNSTIIINKERLQTQQNGLDEISELINDTMRQELDKVEKHFEGSSFYEFVNYGGVKDICVQNDWAPQVKAFCENYETKTAAGIVKGCKYPHSNTPENCALKYDPESHLCVPTRAYCRGFGVGNRDPMRRISHKNYKIQLDDTGENFKYIDPGENAKDCVNGLAQSSLEGIIGKTNTRGIVNADCNLSNECCNSLDCQDKFSETDPNRAFCISNKCRYALVSRKVGDSCFRDKECTSWKCSNGECVGNPGKKDGGIKCDTRQNKYPRCKDCANGWIRPYTDFGLFKIKALDDFCCHNDEPNCNSVTSKNTNQDEFGRYSRALGDSCEANYQCISENVIMENVLNIQVQIVDTYVVFLLIVICVRMGLLEKIHMEVILNIIV